LPAPDIDGLAFQTRTVLRWARNLAGTFPAHAWLARPVGAGNHAYWLFGHVVASSDWSPAVTGAVSILPPGLDNLFGTGSKPRANGEGYPGIEELAPWLDQTLARNLAMIQTLDPDVLDEPPAVPVAEEGARLMRTRERFLFFQPLHLAYHLGQIEWLRKTMG